MVVRLILSVVVGLTLSLSPAVFAMKQLELKSHSHIAAIDIPLSVKEKAWLAGQPTLTIGTWLPEMTPIVYDGDEKSYQGINADYLALMKHSLGLKVIIRQYDTEQQALAALDDRQVDTLLTQVAHRDALAAGLVRTAPLIKTWPALVTSLKSPLPPLTTDRRVTLACTRECAFFDIIQQAFPNAKITLYDSDYQALASVVSGENQYFIGNNTIFVSRNNTTASSPATIGRSYTRSSIVSFMPSTAIPRCGSCKTGSTAAICRFSIPPSPLAPRSSAGCRSIVASACWSTPIFRRLPWWITKMSCAASWPIC